MQSQLIKSTIFFQDLLSSYTISKSLYCISSVDEM